MAVECNVILLLESKGLYVFRLSHDLGQPYFIFVLRYEKLNF